MMLIAVIIISVNLRFPRQVNGLRRVSLPKRLQEAAAIPEEGFVRVDRAASPVRALTLTAVESPVPAGVRDPDRPRRLNRTRQVTLPAPLMEAIDLQILQWVYVSLSEDHAAVLVEPAAMS